MDYEKEMKKIRGKTVGDVMQTKVGWLNENDPLEKAVDVLCSSELSMLPVRNKKKELVGAVVERDLLKAIIDPKHMKSQEIMFEPLLAMSYYPQKVSDVMRKIKFSLKPEDSVEYAARKMYEKRTVLAPVKKDNKIVGIVMEDDLIRLMSDPIGETTCKIKKLEEEEL